MIDVDGMDAEQLTEFVSVSSRMTSEFLSKKSILGQWRYEYMAMMEDNMRCADKLKSMIIQLNAELEVNKSRITTETIVQETTTVQPAGESPVTTETEIVVEETTVK